jgi:hypothetical protein
VTKITGIKLVDLDYSALADMALDAVKVELYRGQFQRSTNPPVRCRLNRYSGRAIVLDETGRHIAEAARAEGQDFVLAAIVDN